MPMATGGYTDVDRRFMNYVPFPTAGNECWEWRGGQARGGYGRFAVNSATKYMAHRYAYELWTGPIPNGMELDHLCRNRLCVRPDHLEPVTWEENLKRGVGTWINKRNDTSCKREHPFDDANTYWRPDGRRGCKTCRAATSKEFEKTRVRRWS